MILVRMLPPIVVTIPLFPAVNALHLNDTHAILILLYAAFFVSPAGNARIQRLAANPDLTAFISTGAFTQWYDNAYRQAAEPYKDKLDSGEMSIIVADTLPMQMDQLKDGLSKGQVGQRPFEMGYRAMFILKDRSEGKSVDDPIYTGLDVCTPDNAEDCLSG